MKKFILVFIILILCGCSNKFTLENKYYEKGQVIDTTSDEINKMTENKESFAVFIYLSSCSTCSKFNSVLSEFVEKNSITFYAISVSDIEDTSICECVKYSPSVALYEKGEIKAYLDANSDKDKKYYSDVKTFTKWFTKYVNINN